MDIRIRHARSQDLPAIVEIFNQGIRTRMSTGYLTEVTVADRKAWFKNHSPKTYPLLVAICDDAVVGYISLDPYRAGREAFRHTTEASLFVHENFRGQGVGNLLLSAAVDAAWALGFTAILAIVLDQNTGSIRLLEKHGFSQWGLFPEVGEIDGTRFNHLYFGLRLTPK